MNYTWSKFNVLNWDKNKINNKIFNKAKYQYLQACQTVARASGVLVTCSDRPRGRSRLFSELCRQLPEDHPCWQRHLTAWVCRNRSKRRTDQCDQSVGHGTPPQQWRLGCREMQQRPAIVSYPGESPPANMHTCVKMCTELNWTKTLVKLCCMDCTKQPTAIQLISF